MSRRPDAWTAVRDRPWRFLGSAWPWRSLAYLLTSVPVGLAALAILLCTVLIGALTLVLVVGVVVLASVPLLAGLLGVVERRRLALVQVGAPAGMTLRERLAAGRRLPVSWAEVGYAFLLGTLLWVVDLMVLLFCVTIPATLLLAPWLTEVDRMEVLGWRVGPGAEAWLAVALGLVALVVAAYAVSVAAAAQAALARLLLDPREAQLAAAVADLRRSRVELVDAFET